MLRFLEVPQEIIEAAIHQHPFIDSTGRAWEVKEKLALKNDFFQPIIHQRNEWVQDYIAALYQGTILPSALRLEHLAHDTLPGLAITLDEDNTSTIPPHKGVFGLNPENGSVMPLAFPANNLDENIGEKVVHFTDTITIQLPLFPINGEEEKKKKTSIDVNIDCYLILIQGMEEAPTLENVQSAGEQARATRAPIVIPPLLIPPALLARRVAPQPPRLPLSVLQAALRAVMAQRNQTAAAQGPSTPTTAEAPIPTSPESSTTTREESRPEDSTHVQAIGVPTQVEGVATLTNEIPVHAVTTSTIVEEPKQTASLINSMVGTAQPVNEPPVNETPVHVGEVTTSTIVEEPKQTASLINSTVGTAQPVNEPPVNETPVHVGEVTTSTIGEEPKQAKDLPIPTVGMAQPVNEPPVNETPVHVGEVTTSTIVEEPKQTASLSTSTIDTTQPTNETPVHVGEVTTPTIEEESKLTVSTPILTANPIQPSTVAPQSTIETPVPAIRLTHEQQTLVDKLVSKKGGMALSSAELQNIAALDPKTILITQYSQLYFLCVLSRKNLEC